MPYRVIPSAEGRPSALIFLPFRSFFCQPENLCASMPWLLRPVKEKGWVVMFPNPF
jgi:hypothetical protein